MTSTAFTMRDPSDTFNDMEQLNKVELRGILGTIRLQNVGGSSYVSMSVATNYAYKDKEGYAVIETTWHNVKAWEGRNTCDLNTLQKGDKVYVLGRLRCMKYISNDGQEKTAWEVIASQVKRIEE